MSRCHQHPQRRRAPQVFDESAVPQRPRGRADWRLAMTWEWAQSSPQESTRQQPDRVVVDWTAKDALGFPLADDDTRAFVEKELKRAN